MLLVACALALALAGVALAGNGGVAPPTPRSPTTRNISDIYWLVLIVTGAVFVLVEGLLVLFVLRYRSRGRARTVEGAQVHGHTRLELIWTAFPVVLLAVIVAFTLAKLGGTRTVQAAPGQQPLRIRIDAHQFYWQFTYPDGQVSIDELRVPVNQPVKLDIYSQDVPHSWWIPQLDGKFDAIPGQVNRTGFKADRQGTYRGQCGEFCGVFHAVMQARVTVTSQRAFRSWLARGAQRNLGKVEWNGVCAKCHGPQGAGGYGPAVTSSPTLTTFPALKTLLYNGRGKMPPVGRRWTDAQIRALIAYAQKNVAGRGGAGGG